MNDVIQWLAVCGGGGGRSLSRYYRPTNEEIIRQITEQLTAEYREISRMAIAALAYTRKYETDALERLTGLVPAQSTPPTATGRDSLTTWLPFGGRGYRLCPVPLTRPVQTLAVLVTDTSGRKHFVPHQNFTAFEYAKAMYDFAPLPTVAKIDTVLLAGPHSSAQLRKHHALRGHGREEFERPWRKKWGHIIGLRHTNTDSIIRALQVQPPSPHIPPSPVARPTTPAIAPPPQVPQVPPIIPSPVGIPTTPEIAPVGGTTTNWLVVGGIAAAVLIGGVLLRRMR